MGGHHHDRPKPILHKGCYSRDIPVFNTDVELRKELKVWMSHCVTSRTINPHSHKHYHRENELVDNNDSVDSLWESIRRLPAQPIYVEHPAPQKVRVYAHYQWKRSLHGDWGVKSVTFTLTPEPYTKITFDEMNVDTSLRPLFEERKDRLGSDTQKGEEILETQAKRVHEIAKSIISRPNNPTQPDSASVAKDGLSGKPHGALAEALVGAFIEIGRAAVVGDIARARLDMYEYYVYGLLSGVTSDSDPSPVTARQKQFYQLGQADAKNLTSVERYQLALSLLSYYAHSPKNHQPRGFELDFPDDYRTYWHTSVMEEGFRAYMKKKLYTYD